MEMGKKLSIMQKTYAASIAENVNTYQKLKLLDSVVERKKQHQEQTAHLINQQLGIENLEEVFSKMVEVFGCANWSVEKAENGYTAKATACMLAALSKKMGGANPCHGWCLNPMIAMITAVSQGEVTDQNILIKSTLMEGDNCQIQIQIKKIECMRDY